MTGPTGIIGREYQGELCPYRIRCTRESSIQGFLYRRTRDNAGILAPVRNGPDCHAKMLGKRFIAHPQCAA